METAEPIDLYLDLLVRTLTRFDMGSDHYPATMRNRLARVLASAVSGPLGRRRIQINSVRPFSAATRMEGRDHPAYAETMIGIKRLDNVRYCVTTAISDGVPGDLMEAGVWRGGAAILMRAILKANGVDDRVVWAADSFEGLPPPDPSVVADAGDTLYLDEALAVSLEEVKANFAKYGLLDDRTKFLKGWFSDTLPGAPIESLAVLRADGDMFASTMDILTSLYPKVSPGGFVIIDDYNDIPACRKAVDEYRQASGITDTIVAVDWTGVYWRKT